MQDPAQEEGLRWSALDWEAQAGPGCPSVWGRRRGGVLKAQRGSWAGKPRGQKVDHAGGNNGATALRERGQGAENGGGRRGT